jgi:hypothetical protein
VLWAGLGGTRRLVESTFTNIALKRPVYYHAKMKLEDIGDKANFVKFMSSQVASVFSIVVNWRRWLKLGKLKWSKKVIVFLVDKLFKRIFNNKPLWMR